MPAVLLLPYRCSSSVAFDMHERSEATSLHTIVRACSSSSSLTDDTLAWPSRLNDEWSIASEWSICRARSSALT